MQNSIIVFPFWQFPICRDALFQDATGFGGELALVTSVLFLAITFDAKKRLNYNAFKHHRFSFLRMSNNPPAFVQ